MKDEALRMALEALEIYVKGYADRHKSLYPTITAIKQALAQTKSDDNGGKTGWPPGLLQDDHSGLSRWLASKLDARQKVREALADHIGDANKMVEQPEPEPEGEEHMIYMTFNQWADGNFLETGEPRREAYSQAELDLVEMGWNYGYDAGVQWQKSQQALDRMADNERELGLTYEFDPEAEKPEPHSWYSAEHDEWMTNKTRKEHEALNSYTHKVGGFDLPLYTTPPQREWVGLTDEDKQEAFDETQEASGGFWEFAEYLEAKLKAKNGFPQTEKNT